MPLSSMSSSEAGSHPRRLSSLPNNPVALPFYIYRRSSDTPIQSTLISFSICMLPYTFNNIFYCFHIPKFLYFIKFSCSCFLFEILIYNIIIVFAQIDILIVSEFCMVKSPILNISFDTLIFLCP